VTDTVIYPQMHTFTIHLTAPPVEGLYPTEWRMVHENVEWFGDTVRRLVEVDATCPLLSGGAYSCEASIREHTGVPVRNVEVVLDAYAVAPDEPRRLAGHAASYTDDQGLASVELETAEPIQQLVCEAVGVNSTPPPTKSATDPVAVPDGTTLSLDLTTLPDAANRVQFEGLNFGKATARLYQSGPYDKPVVVPSPFDGAEQTPARRTEAMFYRLFDPIMPKLYDAGFDVWLVKTKTGQNIHEQAAEFAQAIDYAAWRAGPNAKAIVLGYSLGGVTARLATARFEDDAQWREELRLRDELPVSLVAFGDAPLLGAHINLCLQDGLWEIGRKQEALPGNGFAPEDANLNSCAAQQLLRQSASGLSRARVQSETKNWERFWQTGDPLYFYPRGVCDRRGSAPRLRTPDPGDTVPACVCEEGPAVFETGIGGWPTGPRIIAFSDGHSGPMMCYGDGQDENRDGVPCCHIPAGGPKPYEIQLGDLLYTVKIPLEPDPPPCVARAEDLQGGSRLGGDSTEVRGVLGILFKGGVEQHMTGVFIPHFSALPAGAPFEETQDNTLQGVHGKGYDELIDWVVDQMKQVSE
jgi:hypothetical protein